MVSIKRCGSRKSSFSLISMVDGARPYSGELPLSMTASMSRITVRKILGAPCESKEPVKILRYRGTVVATSTAWMILVIRCSRRISIS